MAQNSVGLEFSEHDIKFVELSGSGGKIRLKNFGAVKIPAGVIEGGSIRRAADLKKTLIALKKKIKNGSVTVSFLPDQIFLADILSEAGFKNPYFESTGIALARLLPDVKESEGVMAVHFGENLTEMVVVEKREVEFLSVLNFGRAIYENLADREAVLPFLAEKIDEQFISWHTHDDNRHKTRPLIKKIFLAGGLPNLHKIAEYLGPRVRVPVERMPVWEKYVDLEEYIPEMTAEESVAYSVPIGLALRQFTK